MSFFKKTALAVVVIFGALAAYYSLSGAGTLPVATPAVSTLSAASVQAGVAEKVSSPSSAVSSPVELPENRTYLSDYEKEKIMAWQRSHGYFSDSELEEYKTYDRETLKKLAVDGDFKAMELMARDLIFRGEDALTAFYFSALRGSTHAFLASTWLIESKLMSEEFSEAEKTNQLMGALALLTVAGKRGDVMVVEQDMPYFKSHHNFYPSLEQQQKIDAAAEGIYQRMATQRSEMGLPPFDNSVPPEMQKILELGRAVKSN